MGTLTFADIKTEVKGFLGDRDDFDARIPNIINLAQMRIARLSVFEELNTTNTGDLTYTGSLVNDKVYTLPTNLRNIYSIKVYEDTGTRFKRLHGLSSMEFDKKIVMPEKIQTKSMPTFYHRWGDQIEMFPIIDKDYKIDVRYSAWPTALSADADLSELDEKDDALIVLSASWMFMSLKKKEDANFQWTVYKNMMKDILGEDRESADIDYGVGQDRYIGRGYDDPFIRSMG